MLDMFVMRREDRVDEALQAELGVFAEFQDEVLTGDFVESWGLGLENVNRCHICGIIGGH